MEPRGPRHPGEVFVMGCQEVVHADRLKRATWFYFVVAWLFTSHALKTVPNLSKLMRNIIPSVKNRYQWLI